MSRNLVALALALSFVVAGCTTVTRFGDDSKSGAASAESVDGRCEAQLVGTMAPSIDAHYVWWNSDVTKCGEACDADADCLDDDFICHQGACVYRHESVCKEIPAGLYVELTWKSETDPYKVAVAQANGYCVMEADRCGADLDLHFVHENAVGLDLDENGTPDGWFDQPYDVFWANEWPNWGDLGNQVRGDDPRLLEDSVGENMAALGGSNREQLVLMTPEPGVSYRIGVHHGFHNHIPGAARATVRVFVHGVLVREWTHVSLDENDMWHVATIHWSEHVDEVRLCTPGEAPEDGITHDYIHPLYNPADR